MLIISLFIEQVNSLWIYIELTCSIFTFIILSELEVK